MALSSMIMVLISLINGLYCPICWTLHLFSFINLGILFFIFKRDLLWPFSFILTSLKQKDLYILGGIILGAGLFFHISFMTVFDIKNQQESLTALFSDWKHEKAIEIQPVSLLQNGTEGSKIVIVEFADFLCPACKKVQPALKQFLSHFPDVEFQFYAYPLDGVCNHSVDFVLSGLSCELSKAVVCAKKQNKGWPLHDFIFENQNRFSKSRGNEEKIKTLFGNMLTHAGINREEFDLCMKDPETFEKIKQSSQAVEKDNIQGTPAFFINGKKIRYYSEKLLILQKIYEHLKREK